MNETDIVYLSLKSFEVTAKIPDLKYLHEDKHRGETFIFSVQIFTTMSIKKQVGCMCGCM